MQLPEELVLRVLGFLEYDTILVTSQVSKKLSRIASDGSLWKLLFEKDLDLLPFVQNTTFMVNKPSHVRATMKSWKEFYYESYFKQKPKYQQDTSLTAGSSFALSTSSFLRTQRSRILYIGPKHAGKSRLFYHLKFGTQFKGIYYLRKFGTVVSIDLNVGCSKLKKTTPATEPHFTDILSADLEVWDAEDFEESPFKRTHIAEGVVIVVDSTSLANPVIVQHLQSLQTTSHIEGTVPVLVLATKWDDTHAARAATISRVLDLWNNTTRPWRIQSCCSTTLLGVKEGLNWLHTEMREKKTWES